LTSKSLKQLKESDFSKLFRNLWKVFFITDDTESQKNRSVNFQAPTILIEYNRDICLSSIKAEHDFYSNVTKSSLLSVLCDFCCKFSYAHKELNADLQTLLETHIEQDIELKITSWFINEFVEEHIRYLNAQKYDDIKQETINTLKDIAKSYSCLDQFIDFAIKYWGESTNFHSAKRRFTNTISIISNDLNLTPTKNLLNVSNSNYQIYKGFSLSDKIVLISEKHESEIDKSQYDNIFRMLKKIYSTFNQQLF
jgi:hypothetical protein